MRNPRTERPAHHEYAPYYETYVKLVPDGDIVAALRRETRVTRDLLAPLTDDEAEHRYADGKWSIKEVVGHLMDVERVFQSRALWFARSDPAGLPGFDENTWTPAGEFGLRGLPSLLEELAAVRTATVALFDGLPSEHWTRRGIANDVTFTVRGIAWITAGHEIHHRRILEDRYLS